MEKSRGMWVVLGISLACLLALGASPAQASDVACGSTIGPGLVTLHENVGPCTGDGVTLAAGTTLDMDGFDILGDEACTTSSGTGVGVKMSKDSEVKNHGRVAHFRVGIEIKSTGLPAMALGTNNRVQELTVERNCVTGIHLIDTSGNTVEYTTVYKTENPPVACVGIRLESSHDNSIQFNTVAENGEPASGDAGIRLVSSNDNFVLVNSVLLNGGTSTSSDGGIVISGDGNNVHGNILNDNTPASRQINEVSGTGNVYSQNKCTPAASFPAGLCN